MPHMWLTWLYLGSASLVACCSPHRGVLPRAKTCCHTAEALGTLYSCCTTRCRGPGRRFEVAEEYSPQGTPMKASRWQWHRAAPRGTQHIHHPNRAWTCARSIECCRHAGCACLCDGPWPRPRAFSPAVGACPRSCCACCSTAGAAISEMPTHVPSECISSS
jgi:hypothetical protein